MLRPALAFGLLATAAFAADTRFEISYPASVKSGPLTGRVFIMISRTADREPRLEIGRVGVPFFGRDFEKLAPGQSAVIDATDLGTPVESITQIPPGDYYVQAFLNIYSEFKRADGHTVWMHDDQWEGQRWNRSPGNLYSAPQKMTLDAAKGYKISLVCDHVIPPIEMTKDTEYVKRFRMQSPMLSKFWGRPIYFGATVLLPRDYSKTSIEYPVLYSQGHFSTAAPLRFAPGDDRGIYPEWMKDGFPRMIAVTWQHPTPYFDDSYAVNSANNGPYGDALLQELIPYLEDHFRMIREPYARLLTGGSTGGWESLALQLYHPGFFGGTWTFYPDPLDFHKFQMMNIYEDPNAFSAPGYAFQVPERPMMRTAEGQVLQTMREMAQLEAALGSKGRSGQQLEAFEAVFGPVGDDGYPKPLVDKLTGKIDREVANYMRDHGYDLTYYTKTNWKEIGPKLKGKIHVYVGDMDNFYLNLGVYLFEDFMKTTDAAAKFEYGRPMKGHGWQPMSNAELVKMMAEQVERNKPR